MESTIQDHSQLKGWGLDADPENDPTYPMKRRTNAEQRGYSWERPKQQPVDMEVLTSIERPNVSAVFGTSVPPRGLSGVLRRIAYRSSESSYARWLTLLFADRVNVVEGVLSDMAGGHFPNILSEKGYGARWKHDRKGVIVSVATTAAITIAIVALIASRRRAGRK